jgi:hypothetical protein
MYLPEKPEAPVTATRTPAPNLVDRTFMPSDNEPPILPGSERSAAKERCQEAAVPCERPGAIGYPQGLSRRTGRGSAGKWLFSRQTLRSCIEMMKTARTPFWRMLPHVTIDSPRHRLGSPIALRAAIAARISEVKATCDSTARLEPGNDLRPYLRVGGTPDERAQMR